MTTTLELINAISQGNAVDTEAAFNAAMAEKISSKLDDMRIDVAKSMYAPQAAASTETQVEEPSEEV
jgi:hypothetical protein